MLMTLLRTSVADNISVEMSDKICEVHIEVRRCLHVRGSLLTTTLTPKSELLDSYWWKSPL
jgi:hypothetical protein